MLHIRQLTPTLLIIVLVISGAMVPDVSALIQESTSCEVTATYQVNLRHGPGTIFEIGDILPAGASAEVDKQIAAADDYTWYHLTRGLWVREDVVNVPDECKNVPVVTADSGDMSGVEIALVEDENLSQWVPRPTSFMPTEWQPPEDGVARYLFELKSTINILQYCPYSGGRTLIRRRVDTLATLTDLMTGEVLASKEFPGEQPRACSTFETFGENQSQKFITGGPEKKVIADWFLETVFTNAEFPSALPVLSGYKFVDAHYSPDNSLIVTVVSRDDNAYVWRAENSQRLFELSHHDHVNHAEFSPDGRSIVTASQDQVVRLWDAQTGEKTLSLFGHDAEVYSASFSPDGRRIVSGSADKTARIWDIDTGTEISRLAGQDTIRDARFSPDGRFVITAGDDGAVRLWDAGTGEEVRVLAAHRAEVRRVLYCSDQLVTGGYDHDVKLWDAETGELLQDWHRSGMHDLDCSSDGRYLLTTQTNRAYVLDGKTGEELWEIEQSGITSASFSPDGTYILTTSSSNEVARTWDVSQDTEAPAP